MSTPSAMKKKQSLLNGSLQTDMMFTEDFIRYARPLIQGNISVPLGEDGLPEFVYRK